MYIFLLCFDVYFNGSFKDVMSSLSIPVADNDVGTDGSVSPVGSCQVNTRPLLAPYCPSDTH